MCTSYVCLAQVDENEGITNSVAMVSLQRQDIKEFIILQKVCIS